MENYCYNSSSYPGSGHSSPRSREIEYENPTPWEETNQPPPNYKVKFMCSYGGQIQPRPHDNQLSYIGGETKILAVDRTVKFANLLSKLVAMCDSDAISFKYQLPGEDLDALISVTNDDDLEHMMHEYDRLFRVSPKPARLRIFVFVNSNSNSSASVRGFGSDEVKTDKERFVEALNSAPTVAAVQQPVSPASAAAQMQPASGNVDFLFGFEKLNSNPSGGGVKAAHHQPPICQVHELEDPVVSPGLEDPIQKHIQDLQRLRIEEQQGLYRRKFEDTISAVPEYYKAQEKISQVGVPGGVPYWAAAAAEKQVPAVSNDQPIYVIPNPSGTYHAPLVRPMTAPPSQGGYYTVQRIPTEIYREQQPPPQQQQQAVYGMIPSGGVAAATALPSQVTGYPDGIQMIRSANAAAAGMVPESAYAPVAYDSSSGRSVIYSTPAGLVGTAAQYHVLGGGDARQSGGFTTETGKLAKTQAPIQYDGR